MMLRNAGRSRYHWETLCRPCGVHLCGCENANMHLNIYTNHERPWSHKKKYIYIYILTEAMIFSYRTCTIFPTLIPILRLKTNMFLQISWWNCDFCVNLWLQTNIFVKTSGWKLGFLLKSLDKNCDCCVNLWLQTNICVRHRPWPKRACFPKPNTYYSRPWLTQNILFS